MKRYFQIASNTRGRKSQQSSALGRRASGAASVVSISRWNSAEIRDDRFLRMVVVVEIARADAHFEGDRRRRHRRLAKLVEHRQGGLENPFTRPAGRLWRHRVS